LLFHETLPWYIFYAAHNADTSLRWRKSTTGISGFGAEQIITFGNSVSYAQAFRITESRIIVFVRVIPGRWWFVYSDDEGSTWSAPRPWFYFSSNSSYTAMKQRPDGSIAVASHDHPLTGTNQDVYYCEIATNGDVTTPTSPTPTTLGNIYTSSQIILTDCLRVYESGTGERTRLWDVSAHREVVVAIWSVDGGGDGELAYFAFDNAGGWDQYLIGDAGTFIENPSEDGYERGYTAGSCLSNTEGTLYYCSDDFGGLNWEVRKCVFNGAGFDKTVIRDASTPKRKFRPAVPINATQSIAVTWIEGDYTGYRNYYTDILGGS
jgi:hypothetical protein